MLPLDEPARPLLERFKKKGTKFTEAEAAPFLEQAPASFLSSLLERRLIQPTTKQRKPAYQVTPDAREALKAAKKAADSTAKTPPASRAKKAPPATLDDLRAMEARILERLDALVLRLAVGAAPSLPRTSPEPAPPPLPHQPIPVPSPAPQPRNGDLGAAIAHAIRDADLGGRHAGLVPIPEVRKLVLSRTGASRTQFDETLLKLEREFRVDLKIANDPRRPDAAEGIAVPGRGLVFFALAK